MPPSISRPWGVGTLSAIARLSNGPWHMDRLVCNRITIGRPGKLLSLDHLGQQAKDLLVLNNQLENHDALRITQAATEQVMNGTFQFDSFLSGRGVPFVTAEPGLAPALGPGVRPSVQMVGRSRDLRIRS